MATFLQGNKLKNIKIRIDLASPVIKADQPVYMLHPGKGYHLFGGFLANSTIATDLPNLDLFDGLSPNRAENIDAQISRSRAMRDWLNLNESQRASTIVDLDLKKYLTESKRRYHDSYIENLVEILWNFPTGTVVFVPSPDLSMSGFFCELKPNTENRVKFKGNGAARDYTYLGRPVDNIKKVDMRLIPKEILDSKSRQSVITELDGTLSERMYRLYYGSFIISGGIHQIEVDVPSDTFRPGDSNIVNALANMIEDNLQKSFDPAVAPKTGATSLEDAAFMAFDGSELQMHARLNSQGVLQIAAKSITPLLVSIILSLGTQASSQEIFDALKNTQITVENSRCPMDKDFTKSVEKGFYSVIQMMGEKNVADICRRVTQLRDRTKVTTDTRVQVEK